MKEDMSPGCLQVKLDERGYHILACDCDSRHWLVILKRDEATDKGVLRLFCGLCNSYSGPMVPQDERDQKLLTEAQKELEAKEDNNWGTEVDSATKKGGGHLN